MRSHAAFEPIVTKFCMWGWMGNVITDAKFFENLSKGFGVTGTPPPKRRFLYLMLITLKNSVSTTVLHSDYLQTLNKSLDP